MLLAYNFIRHAIEDRDTLRSNWLGVRPILDVHKIHFVWPVKFLLDNGISETDGKTGTSKFLSRYEMID